VPIDYWLRIGFDARLVRHTRDAAAKRVHINLPELAKLESLARFVQFETMQNLVRPVKAVATIVLKNETSTYLPKNNTQSVLTARTARFLAKVLGWLNALAN
jgi:hypothetical protein